MFNLFQNVMDIGISVNSGLNLSNQSRQKRSFLALVLMEKQLITSDPGFLVQISSRLQFNLARFLCYLYEEKAENSLQ